MEITGNPVHPLNPPLHVKNRQGRKCNALTRDGNISPNSGEITLGTFHHLKPC